MLSKFRRFREEPRTAHLAQKEMNARTRDLHQLLARQEIFRGIGAGDRTFFESGVGYGLENNTVSLLHSGWCGAWIDANPDAAQWKACATTG